MTGTHEKGQMTRTRPNVCLIRLLQPALLHRAAGSSSSRACRALRWGRVGEGRARPLLLSVTGDTLSLPVLTATVRWHWETCGFSQAWCSLHSHHGLQGLS